MVQICREQLTSLCDGHVTVLHELHSRDRVRLSSNQLTRSVDQDDIQYTVPYCSAVYDRISAETEQLVDLICDI